MVRDGRATVHSIISRHVTITGFNLSSYRQCMEKWNVAIEVMHNQCKDMGPERCMMVSGPNSFILMLIGSGGTNETSQDNEPATL